MVHRGQGHLLLPGVVDLDSLPDALAGHGFTVDGDPGATWVRSQMPALGIGEIRHVARRNRRPREIGVTLRLARRDDRDARIAVFVYPPGAGWAHDRLLIAVDPRDRALVAAPAPERLEGTGWIAESFGMWLLVYRAEPQETTTETIAAVVDEGIAMARRALAGGGLR